MDITIDLNLGGPIGKPPTMQRLTLQRKYGDSCYRSVAAAFHVYWEALCNCTPTDRPFKGRIITDTFPGLFSNKDHFGAFMHICQALGIDQGELTDRHFIERRSTGLYQWRF